MLADLPTWKKEIMYTFARRSHKRKDTSFTFQSFLELVNHKTTLSSPIFFLNYKKLPQKVLIFHIWACVQLNFTKALSVSLLFP